MTVTRKGCAVSGLLVMVACGGKGTGANQSLAAGGASVPAPSNADDDPGQPSFTPLDLETQEVADWVSLANGHHEIPLAWHRDFPIDPVSGYEEHTVLVLDVTVLEGTSVRFTANDASGFVDPEE